MLQRLGQPHVGIQRVLDGKWHSIDDAQDRQIVGALHDVISQTDLNTVLLGEVWQAVDVLG